MSIKYKIAFLFAVAVTLILAAVSIAVYFFSVKDNDDSFRTRLRNRAISAAGIIRQSNENDFSVIRSLDTSAVASLHQKSIAVINDNGKLIYHYSDLAGDSILISPATLARVKEKDIFFSEGNKKAVAIYTSGGHTNLIIAVAANDVEGKAYLKQLKKILWTASLIAVAISFLTGLLFARNLIAPFKRIASEVNMITSNNLSQRIKSGNNNDELDKLATTINELLDRLDESFMIQRRFISNASHELSTPLTSISSQLEVTMQKERTPEEYRDVMNSVYEDIKELQHLTRSLLDIAKTGSQGSIDLMEVRLDEVLFKVAADVQHLNKKYKTTFSIDVFPDDEKLLTVFGNSNLLYIALKNIIENGCKYSDNGESVINILTGEKNIIIRVANNGDIIAESDIQNIFQPFFRTDNAQVKPGFGLGLAMTRRIISLHNGKISVESNPEKGTVFSIQLPNILAL